MARSRASSSTISWAHVSDFHFESGKDYGRDEVMAALLADVAAHRPLDMVLVTGDIAHGGKAAEYKVAAVFFDRLGEAAGVPRERFFVVRGNHDVDRNRDAPSLLRDSVVGQDRFKQLWANAPTRAALERKLAAYRRFARRFKLEPAAFGGFSTRVEAQGRTIAVVGLSSPWLGKGREAETEYGRLIVGKEQLYELAGGVAMDGVKSADLRIALVHHPLDWLQEFDRADIAVAAGQELRPGAPRPHAQGVAHAPDLAR